MLLPAISSVVCQSSQPADPRGIRSSHGPPEDSVTEEWLPRGVHKPAALLLLHILTHEPFDIVDFIIAEIEDVITDGMGVVRQFPYAHWISYICSMIMPAESPVSVVYRQDEAPRFPVYRPTAPQNRRRGRQSHYGMTIT